MIILFAGCVTCYEIATGEPKCVIGWVWVEGGEPEDYIEAERLMLQESWKVYSPETHTGHKPSVAEIPFGIIKAVYETNIGEELQEIDVHVRKQVNDVLEDVFGGE